MQRPQLSEYNPRFSNYISKVPDGNYLDLLNDNTVATILFFDEMPEAKHDFAYAESKWTVKQVLQHIIDTERVMSYRALVALRGDSLTLMGSMDENSYADHADVSHKSMNDLLTEFMAVRTATTKLFDHVNEERSLRTANVVNIPTTARALGYIIIGHVIHHLEVTKERYF